MTFLAGKCAHRRELEQYFDESRWVVIRGYDHADHDCLPITGPSETQNGNAKGSTGLSHGGPV